MVARAYTIKNGKLPNNLSKDKAGDLAVMLKSALTTGYNSKPSAGWKLVYDSITNSNDTVRRIVVQSQSPSSEQRYYEIVDNVAQNAQLTMYESWDSTTFKGYGKSVSLKIYGSDGNDYGLVANEYFVSYIWGGKSYWFGDYDEFDIANKSIIFGQTDTNSSSYTIPSQSNNTAVGSRTIRDINNNVLVLRSEHGQWQGWANWINWSANAGGVYYSPATARLFAKPIDVLQMVGSQAIYRGTMPMMVFCNRLPSATDTAENGKKIYIGGASYTGDLLYLVDEL